MSEICADNLYNIISQVGPYEALILVRLSHESEISRQGVKYLNNKGCADPPTHCEDVVDQLWEGIVSPKFEGIYSGDKVSPIRNLKAWLTENLRWTVIHHLSKICPIQFTIEDYENETATKNNPELIYLEKEQEKERLRIAEIALSRLNETERAVLILKEHDGMSHFEISTRLNISEDNSKTILRRAKIKVGAIATRLGANK
jgi:RNA polymerase sigma factor (sigma-70 family)